MANSKAALQNKRLHSRATCYKGCGARFIFFMQLFERNPGSAVASTREDSHVLEPEQSERPVTSSLASLRNYALAGAGATLLLGLIDASFIIGVGLALWFATGNPLLASLG